MAQSLAQRSAARPNQRKYAISRLQGLQCSVSGEDPWSRQKPLNRRPRDRSFFTKQILANQGQLELKECIPKLQGCTDRKEAVSWRTIIGQLLRAVRHHGAIKRWNSRHKHRERGKRVGHNGRKERSHARERSTKQVQKGWGSIRGERQWLQSSRRARRVDGRHGEVRWNQVYGRAAGGGIHSVS